MPRSEAAGLKKVNQHNFVDIIKMGGVECFHIFWLVLG